MAILSKRILITHFNRRSFIVGRRSIVSTPEEGGICQRCQGLSQSRIRCVWEADISCGTRWTEPRKDAEELVRSDHVHRPPCMWLGRHMTSRAELLTWSQFEMPIGPTIPTASLTQQLLGTQKNNMPPPMTPASKLKKNAQTPGSGLDLRASMTPLHTPSHLRTRQAQPSKRVRAHDEDEESPPKRRACADPRKKRLQSVYTTFMLDTGNISPAPACIHGSDYIKQSPDTYGQGSYV